MPFRLRKRWYAEEAGDDVVSVESHKKGLTAQRRKDTEIKKKVMKEEKKK